MAADQDVKSGSWAEWGRNASGPDSGVENPSRSQGVKSPTGCDGSAGIADQLGREDRQEEDARKRRGKASPCRFGL